MVGLMLNEESKKYIEDFNRECLTTCQVGILKRLGRGTGDTTRILNSATQQVKEGKKVAILTVYPGLYVQQLCDWKELNNVKRLDTIESIKAIKPTEGAVHVYDMHASLSIFLDTPWDSWRGIEPFSNYDSFFISKDCYEQAIYDLNSRLSEALVHINAVDRCLRKVQEEINAIRDRNDEVFRLL